MMFDASKVLLDPVRTVILLIMLMLFRVVRYCAGSPVQACPCESQ